MLNWLIVGAAVAVWIAGWTCAFLGIGSDEWHRKRRQRAEFESRMQHPSLTPPSHVRLHQRFPLPPYDWQRDDD